MKQYSERLKVPLLKHLFYWGWLLIVLLFLSGCLTQPVTTIAITTSSETIRTQDFSGKVPLELIGVQWMWQGTKYPDGSRSFPQQPLDLTIQFFDDNEMLVTADCGDQVGNYNGGSGILFVRVDPIDNQHCAGDALVQDFIDDLNNASVFLVMGEELQIILRFEQGKMQFRRVPGFQADPVTGQPSNAKIIKDTLVRYSPGLEYPIQSALQTGEPVEIIGKSQDGNWWAIKSVNLTSYMGWVDTADLDLDSKVDVPVLEVGPLSTELEFLAPENGQPQASFLDAVFIHEGPGDDYAVIGAISKGSSAIITGRNLDSSWFAVKFEQSFGSQVIGWAPATWVWTENVQNVPVINSFPVSYQHIVSEFTTDSFQVAAFVPVNLYEYADLYSPVIQVAPAGTYFTILGVTQDQIWLKVEIPGDNRSSSDAWIRAEFTLQTPSENSFPVFETANLEKVELPEFIQNPDCVVLAQTSQNYAKIAPGDKFDMVWVVQNISTTTWEQTEFDLRWVDTSNIQLHSGEPNLDLPVTVSPGQSLTANITAQAPTSPGMFVEVWEVVLGNTAICQFYTIIRVIP